MMEPGYFPLTIRRNTPGDVPLTITDTAGDPVDLTELAPFTAQVRPAPGSSTLILEITVAETDLANGQLNLTWTAADVEEAVLQDAAWDLLDDPGNRWVEGPAIITNESVTVLTP